MIIHQIGDFDQLEVYTKKFSNEKCLITKYFIKHSGNIAYAAGRR